MLDGAGFRLTILSHDQPKLNQRLLTTGDHADRIIGGYKPIARIVQRKRWSKQISMPLCIQAPNSNKLIRAFAERRKRRLERSCFQNNRPAERTANRYFTNCSLIRFGYRFGLLGIRERLRGCDEPDAVFENPCWDFLANSAFKKVNFLVGRFCPEPHGRSQAEIAIPHRLSSQQQSKLLRRCEPVKHYHDQVVTFAKCAA